MQLTKRRMHRLLAVMFTVALLGGACGDDKKDSDAQQGGSEAKTSEPIVIAGLEGEVAEGGPDFTKGLQIAADQINAAGGVEGRKIEVRISKTARYDQDFTPATRFGSAIAERHAKRLGPL